MDDRPQTADPPAPETHPVALELSGKTLSFQVSPDRGTPAAFCLGIRKSGSTMLGNIMGFLARRNGYNVVDIPGTAFRNGLTVADWEGADLSRIVVPSNFYTGFRAFPAGIAATDTFKTARKVFMFRDPRDALVSQYFSDAFSHKLPDAKDSAGRELFERKRAEARETDINDYVVQKARGMKRTFLSYVPMLSDPSCLNLRYEEYIFQKKRMIHKTLQHFDWECHPGQVKGILDRIDVIPEQEDQSKFIRKGIPGDHRAKLRPEVIAKLDNILSDVLAAYDYY